MSRYVSFPFCLLLMLFGLAGCGRDSSVQQPDSSTDEAEESVLLFGAASTTNVLDEIRAEFSRQQGIDVETNYAGTSTLVHQIESGAEADLLISAHRRWAEYLEAKGLVARWRDLLQNRLVIVVPADSRIDVQKPEDLLNERVQHVALADPEAVPAGVYAKQALENLRLWNRLKAKVVAGADVRHALSYVETGAAEAGIVYATDAAISTAVHVAVRIDPDLTDPIRYPVVLLNGGAENAAAVSFYEYLSSPQAAEIFQKHGFTVLVR